jgi:hypothetical protein
MGEGMHLFANFYLFFNNYCNEMIWNNAHRGCVL